MFKFITVPLLLGFGVALAYVIGVRMSTDAMAVVIGVAVGVTASVPMSLLLVALLRRQQSRMDIGARPEPQMPAPQVLVLPQLPQPQQTYANYVPLPPEEMGGAHRVRVVGHEQDIL